MIATERTLTAAFEAIVEAVPTKDALRWGTEAWTFTELLIASRRLAGGLASLGVKQGDRVTVFATSVPEQVILFLAVTRLGAINTPANAQWVAPEVRHLLDDSGAKTLFLSSQTLERGLDAVATSGIDNVFLIDRHGDGSPSDRWSSIDRLYGEPYEFDDATPDAVAATFYTSGTTGRPKGAMWSHRNLLYNSLAWTEVFGLTQEDMCLGSYDGRGSGIAIGVLGPLLVGATVVSPVREQAQQLDRSLDASGIIRTISDARVTYMPTAPAIMGILMATAREAGVLELPSVEVIAIGSAATPADMFEPLQRFLPNCRIYHSYGSSEGHFSACPPEALPSKIGSVGFPLPGTQIKIVDSSANETGPDQVGHVAVQGPGVMVGYWQNDAATAAAKMGEFLVMGDLGRIDPEGVLWLHGRDRDLINSGGWNVYAAEVESALSSVDGVQFVGVIGVPDDRLGERVVAYVAPFPGMSVDVEDLRAACTARLARYKRPVEYHMRAALPVNANFKVQKHLLKVEEH